MTRAVAYLRVSTESQAEEDRVSLEDQQKSIQEYCARKGYQLVGSYCDVFSGKRDDRRQYNRMLLFLHSGGADVVVVKFLDRFGRRPKTILRHYWALDDMGIKVEATDEDLSHELVMLVRAGLAGAEVQRISERVKSAMHRRAERGQRVGPLSIGLKADKDGHIVLDEEWAPLVRAMFHLYVRGDDLHPLGYGYRALCQHLNQRGVLTRSQHLWAPGTLKDVLKDRAHIGEVSQAGVNQALAFFTICPGVFDLAQQRMAERDCNQAGALRKPGQGALLSGLLFCALCGKRMQTYVSGRPYTRKRSGECLVYPARRYLCGSRADYGLCRMNSVQIDTLNAEVLAQLAQWCNVSLVAAKLADRLEQADTEQDELRKRKRELQTHLHDLDDTIARKVVAWEKGLIDDQQLGMVSRGARAEREEVTALIERVSQQEAALQQSVRHPEEISSQIAAALARIQDLPVVQQRDILGTVVERVLWDGKQAEVVVRLDKR